MTYTFAVMDVSRKTYDEIRSKMEQAGMRQRAFHENGVIDLHGIAIQTDEPEGKPHKLRIADEPTKRK